MPTDQAIHSPAPNDSPAHTNRFAPHAERAATVLRELEAALQEHAAPSARELARARGFQRFPDAALEIAARTIEGHPERLASFDADAMRAALEFIDAMGTVAQQCRDMAARIDHTAMVLKADAMHEALVVYGTLQHMTRMPQSRSMLPELRELGALVRTTPGKGVRRRVAEPTVGAPMIPASATRPTQ